VTIKVDAIRECLDGVVPGIVATCSSDGVPNVTYLSQVEFVDSDHVALSYQFFNKTRQNVLDNSVARLIVTHPVSGARYRLLVEYLRTETSGPLFERMKAKLAGIASHTGMSGVFRLLGSDVYRVVDVEPVPGTTLPAPPPRRNALSALRTSVERLNACRDLDTLVSEALACLEAQFDIHHTMVLMLDESASRLYTIASRGYEESGVGSEIPLGQGVIGVAAREGTPIRIGHMASEYAYGRAIRAATEQSTLSEALETEIPMPGLPESRSQLAVPIKARQRPLGVLYVESPEDLRFSYDDEDSLVALAGQLGIAIYLLQQAPESLEETVAAAPDRAAVGGAPVVVRHYAENDSVFLDDQYLIKGVAGSILWTLVRDYVERNRTTFSNRELRVDPRIRLPDVSDNLEARLVLLMRRLADRSACVQREKIGRGRLGLSVRSPLKLVDVPTGLPR
jgi:adenylate cyclase